MAGTKGRSGGWNRIDPREHLKRGTFVESRHGAALRALQQPAPAAWIPTAAQRATVGPDGQALIDCVLAAYELSVIEGSVLLEAATALDRLREIRTTRTGVDLKLRLAFNRDEARWQRQFAALLTSLRFPR